MKAMYLTINQKNRWQTFKTYGTENYMILLASKLNDSYWREYKANRALRGSDSSAAVLSVAKCRKNSLFTQPVKCNVILFNSKLHKKWKMISKQKELSEIKLI